MIYKGLRFTWLSPHAVGSCWLILSLALASRSPMQRGVAGRPKVVSLADCVRDLGALGFADQVILLDFVFSRTG